MLKIGGQGKSDRGTQGDSRQTERDEKTETKVKKKGEVSFFSLHGGKKQVGGRKEKWLKRGESCEHTSCNY